MKDYSPPVAVGVLVNPDFTIQAAGGFNIQPMPNKEEESSSPYIVYLNEK
ncbi:hypothetical protein [Metabacillus sp. 22489]